MFLHLFQIILNFMYVCQSISFFYLFIQESRAFYSTSQLLMALEALTHKEAVH